MATLMEMEIKATAHSKMRCGAYRTGAVVAVLDGVRGMLPGEPLFARQSHTGQDRTQGTLEADNEAVW